MLDRTLDNIRHDPRAVVFLLGDVCDSILPKDKRFEAGLTADWIDKSDVLGSQIRYAWKKLKPIAGKVIGILDGNHEETVKKEQSFRVKRYLIECAADCGHYWKDLSYSALVRLQFEWKHENKKSDARYALTLYLHHGWGGGRGQDINHFKDLSSGFQADWFIAGHTHKKYVADAVYHRIAQNGKLIEERRLWGRSGSFLKGIDVGDEAGYAEQRGYLPTPRGALCIRYYPHPNADSTPRGWAWVNET